MMVIDDFEFFVETKGAFKGYKAVVMKTNNAGQKNNKLSVSNHTQKDKANNIIHVPIYQLNADDPMDEYNIIDTYINKLLPPKEMLQGNQRIFRYKARTKQIKVSTIHLSCLEEKDQTVMIRITLCRRWSTVGMPGAYHQSMLVRIVYL